MRAREAVRVTGGFLWDGFMVLLALFSVALLAAAERDTTALTRQRIIQIDLMVVAIFLADWVFWLTRSSDNRTYLKRTWWDLLGMVPLAVPGGMVFGFLRLLRLLRIVRAFEHTRRRLHQSSLVEDAERLIQLALAAATITVLGAVLTWIVESDVEGSQIRSFGDALWWAIVTVSTVGYGDITPVTATGRVVATLLMVTGITILGILVSQLSLSVIRRRESEIADEAVATAIPGTLAGQLAELSILHDDGKLDDEEFSLAKARLLSKEH